MDKILGILSKYKFLLIATGFIIATVVLVVISANRGDELLKEMNEQNVNKNIDIYEQENKDEKVKICLYYINKDSKKVEEEYREIKLLDYIINPENVIITEYIKGSSNPVLIASIPNGTVINKIDIESEIMTIDFKEICGENEALKSVDNNLKLESISKTMKQLKDISKVKFTVNEKSVNEFCSITEFDKEY